MVKSPIPRNKMMKKPPPANNGSSNIEETLNFDSQKHTIKSLTSLMKILHDSQNYLSKENDEFRSRIEKLETENIILLKKNTLNESTIKNLSNEVIELKFEVNELKQDKLEGHFNVNGLPQMTKDKAIEVVVKIAGELDINLTPSDVKEVSCFVNKKTNKADYVFELHKKELKKEFIMKRKSKLLYANNNLEIFGVNSNSSSINRNSSRIFVNDHLCQFNHHLLNHAKSLKNFDFKYVWYKFGKIFIKKDDTSEVISVRSYQTIDNLIQKCQSKV